LARAFDQVAGLSITGVICLHGAELAVPPRRRLLPVRRREPV